MASVMRGNPAVYIAIESGVRLKSVVYQVSHWNLTLEVACSISNDGKKFL